MQENLWFVVYKIVLTYCEKKIGLEIEKNIWSLASEAERQEFAKILSWLEQSSQAVKDQNNFWNITLF